MTKSPTHISIYDQALSFDDCNIITDWMETQDHVRGKHGNGNFDPKIKDSYDVFMSFGGVNRPDIEDKDLMRIPPQGRRGFWISEWTLSLCLSC